jgi:hypothetical protein
VSRAILVVRDKTDLARDKTDFAARLDEALSRAGIVPPVVDVLALLKALRAAKRTRLIPVFVVRPLPEQEKAQ